MYQPRLGVGGGGDVGVLALAVRVLVVDAGTRPARPVGASLGLSAAAGAAVRRAAHTHAASSMYWYPPGLARGTCAPTLIVNGKSDGVDAGRAPVLRGRSASTVERAVVTARHEHVHARGVGRLHRARRTCGRRDVHGREPARRTRPRCTSTILARPSRTTAFTASPNATERRVVVEDGGVRRDRLHALDVHRAFGDRRRARALLSVGPLPTVIRSIGRHVRQPEGVWPTAARSRSLTCPRHDHGDVLALALHAAVVQLGDVERCAPAWRG